MSLLISKLRALIVAAAFAAALPAVLGQINAERMLAVGQNALYFEDYLLSIQYFNQVISAKPYLAKPYLMRSIAKLNLEDFRGAEEDASRAIDRNPFLTDAFEVRGVARQNLGRTAEAVADYDRALSLLPENRGILFNKALAQQSMKDYEGAAMTFERLLKKYPRMANGYAGRASLSLEKGDTVGALADIDRAIELEPEMVNPYVMRADVAIRSHKDYKGALSDMNRAIRLQPRYAGFYINRAFLRYNLDDYRGAMADYDYALSLDPLNAVALFNRGLLRAEVNDRDKAIGDFSAVLRLDNNDYRALYNRAMLYEQNLDYARALADLDRVIDAFPDFDGLLYQRSQILEKTGRRKEAERDYRRARELTRQLTARKPDPDGASGPSATDTSSESAGPTSQPPESLVSDRFSALLTIENSYEPEREFNNNSIRGKLQNRNVPIELRPMFALSFYSTTSELGERPYFIGEVDDINNAHSLRMQLMLTANDQPPIDDDTFENHSRSVEYYNSYLSTHTPRAIDYFGRAMDFMTLRDYERAINDFDRALALAPDFTMSLFMRSVARLRKLTAERNSAPDGRTSAEADYATANIIAKNTLAEVIADLDRVAALSPRMPFSYYNKGVVLAQSGDDDAALNEFSRAIDLKPDFAEAYFNRGFIYLKKGMREPAIADLSRAGELGIVPSYSLIKRMSD